MAVYRCRVLEVDLSAGTTSVSEWSEADSRAYLGGRGVGARVLLGEVPAGADPLGPDNRLVFAAGPLAGTSAPGSGRFAVMAKSPLTGVAGEAYTGGFLAHELRYAGYTALVIRGKAASPVALCIRDGEVTLRDAKRLWGKETAEVERLLRAELGDEGYRIATIGIAGESAVRFACVVNDTDRAAGRTGLGAVMGSKNLKAVAVRGTGAVAVRDMRRFREAALSDLAKIRANGWLGGSLGELGTSGGVEGLDRDGILPTRNWESGTFEHAARISGTAMRDSILIGHRACEACPVGCTRVVQTVSGPFKGARPEYGGPEYETVAALGSLCGNANLEAIALANQKCNAYGMDTISTGSVIAFAMDCFERGLLTEKEVGFPLPWGDAEAIVKLVDLIARREGVGALLAEGTRAAAAKIGPDALALTVQVKGLELGMHEARGKKGLGLSYATAPRGADHMEGFHDPAFTRDNALPELGITKGMSPYSLEGKARHVAAVENYTSFVNTVPICAFMSRTGSGVPNVEELTAMIEEATWWSGLDLEEELAIGERSYNMLRAFTARESGGKPEDRLPHKMGQALRDGATKGQSISDEELGKALREYYAARGWDEHGVPSAAKLRELGLEGVAAGMTGKGGK